MTPPPNPYVGPRAFQPGETLYGRGRELDELRDLLIAERILLLYSPSGAGKTSLIQAALVPALEKRQFTVFPVVRVLGPPRHGKGNRYSRSAVAAITAGDAASSEAIGATGLAGYLRSSVRKGGRHALIFDQFEEVLTADIADLAGRQAFFEELGNALREPNLFVLFAMREDYIAGLDPYRLRLPTQLRSRMRLGFLDPAAARAAMQKPAEAAGVTFPADVADALVEDLRTVSTPAANQTPRVVPFVEPLHLQIVCRNLWEENGLRWEQGEPHRIELPDVGPAANVDLALGAYYNGAVRKAVELAQAPDPRLIERDIRQWFERRLINPEGVRAQVLKSGAGAGLPVAVIAQLADDYLIRSEERHGAIWYELAHDRLIEPVKRCNGEWFAANLAAVERQTQIWDDGGRSAGYLITDDMALLEALEWADRHDTTINSAERAFIDACRAAARKRRRDRLMSRMLIGILLIALIALGVAYRQSGRLKDAGSLIESQKALLKEAERNVAEERAKAHSIRSHANHILAQARAEIAKRVADAEGHVRRLRDEARRRERDLQISIAGARGEATEAKRRAADAENALSAAITQSQRLQTNIEIRSAALGRILERLRAAPTQTEQESLLAELQSLVAEQSTTEAAIETAADAVTNSADQVSVCAALWPNGATLRVRFLDGSPSLHERVLSTAAEWSEAANLRFVASGDPDAEIRLTFSQPGSWAYLGTAAQAVAQGSPTANLGAIAAADVPRSYFHQVVLHEFGHILGLIHENQNPHAHIPWNEEAVFSFFSGPPNNLSREAIQATILRKASLTGYRAFDPQSVMMYGSFPRQLFTRDFELRSNDTLSASDRAFVARLYPRTGTRQC